MSTEWPQDKYINIDLFKKENVNLVFIGHVDSGKSTLTGNIMKELGEVD
jgi:translation elongation factor EF-1alpha